MKILLDINVVLDVLLIRQPWLAEASQVWDAHRNGLVTAGIAAFTVPTVYYIVRRQTDLIHAHDAVRICLETFDIIPVQRKTLENAWALSGNDFEDNLLLSCAVESSLDALVTRDPSGYQSSTIPILTPSELLIRITQGRPS